jgi:hypothetical protein
VRRFPPALRWGLLGLLMLALAYPVGTLAWRHLLDDPGPLSRRATSSCRTAAWPKSPIR